MEPSQCIRIGNACIKIWSRKPTQCIKIACIKIWSREAKAESRIGDACIKIGNACIKIWGDSFSALCDSFRYCEIFSKKFEKIMAGPPARMIITAEDS